MTFEAEKLIAPESARVAPPRARSWAASSAAYGAGLGLLVLVAYRRLIGFDPGASISHDLHGVEGMLFAPSGSSPLLIFSCTAWLLARRAARIRSTLGAPARPLLALALFVPAFVLCAWAYYVQEPSLLLPSLSLSILALALWLGGTEAFRATMLPALFLLLAMPIPPVFVNRFMYSLQVATAHSTANILDALGLATAARGERIYRGDHIFEVIESCSGIRTVETLLMASFLFHDLFYRSRLQSTLIVISSVLIGLLVNQLRVISIVLNPYSQFAAVHTTQGLVMVSVGVLLMAGVDRLLARVLPARPWWRRPQTLYPRPTRRLALACALLLALAATTWLLTPWRSPPPSDVTLATLPPQLDGWTGTGIALDREFLGSATFSEWVHRRYQRAGASVDLLLGANRRLDTRIDLESPKVAILTTGARVAEHGRERLASGRDVQTLRVGDVSGEQLVYVWSYALGSPAEESLRSILALDRGPWRREGRAIVVRLATSADGPPGDAEARLREFAASIEREMTRFAGGV